MMTDDSEPKRVKKEGLPDHINLFFDGASKNNPGPSAGGWCITDVDESELVYGWSFTGENCTNNEAEYDGLLSALNYLKKVQYEGKCEIRGDSKLVIQQIQGKWKVKAKNLIPLCHTIKKIIKELTSIKFTYQHVLREKNTKADEYANSGVTMKSSFLSE